MYELENFLGMQVLRTPKVKYKYIIDVETSEYDEEVTEGNIAVTVSSKRCHGEPKAHVDLGMNIEIEDGTIASINYFAKTRCFGDSGLGDEDISEYWSDADSDKAIRYMKYLTKE